MKLFIKEEPVATTNKTRFYDSELYYIDIDNLFGGGRGEVYSEDDFISYWRANKNEDPILADYDSYEDWFNDTVSDMETVYGYELNESAKRKSYGRIAKRNTLGVGSMYESTNLNESNTLPLDVTGLGKIDIPTTTEFPVGKKIWNIGEHNPYIKDGYIIVCNVREHTIIPETLEFVYVGKDNAKALHKVARRREVNDKNYKKFLVTEID